MKVISTPVAVPKRIRRGCGKVILREGLQAGDVQAHGDRIPATANVGDGADVAIVRGDSPVEPGRGRSPIGDSRRYSTWRC